MVNVIFLNLLFSAIALVEAMPKQSPNEQPGEMFSKRILQTACHTQFSCDHQSDCAGPEKMIIVPDQCSHCWAKYACDADHKVLKNQIKGYWCLGPDDDFCF